MDCRNIQTVAGIKNGAHHRDRNDADRGVNQTLGLRVVS
jgi:hypothetical protein